MHECNGCSQCLRAEAVINQQSAADELKYLQEHHSMSEHWMGAMGVLVMLIGI